MDLPQGWSLAVDDAGRTFYRNDATNSIQWDRPRCEAAAWPPSFQQGARGYGDGNLLMLAQDFAREDAARGQSETMAGSRSVEAASDYISWRDRAGRGEMSSWRERAEGKQTADWERCLDLDRRQFERERSVTSLYLHDKSAWIDRIDRLDRLGERARVGVRECAIESLNLGIDSGRVANAAFT